MKALALAMALAVVVVCPAMAKSNDMARTIHHDRFVNANASIAPRDPIGVYVDGQEVGRDPDPGVRQELKQEYYLRQSN